MDKSIEPINASFKRALLAWADEIDTAYADVRVHCVDWGTTNYDYPDFAKSRERMEYAMKRAFELKSAMREYQRILDARGTDG